MIHDRLVIVRDFNNHTDEPSDHYATELLNITDAFNLIQPVSGCTHCEATALILYLL